MKTGLILPNMPLLVGIRKIFPPPSPDSVLYLPMYPPQVSPTPDLSGQGNNGTITGATWERIPSGLWVLVFDGTDDWVKCGTGTSLNFTSGNFTLKAWINHDDLSSADFIFSRGGYEVDGYDLRILSTGDISFRTHQAGAKQETLSNRVVSATTWYHLVAVRNGTTGYIYINGADQSKTQPVITNPVTSTQNFTIGTYSAGATTSDWDGKMALLEVCNTAWAVTRPLSSYNREKHLFGL